ncbi:hypothetical protein J6590_047902 [Homalodisca vitripennis]|nr:hypothetical protein J6590_047902 [Homalodisca vitripennis]
MFLTLGSLLSGSRSCENPVKTCRLVERLQTISGKNSPPKASIALKHIRVYHLVALTVSTKVGEEQETIELFRGTQRPRETSNLSYGWTQPLRSLIVPYPSVYSGTGKTEGRPQGTDCAFLSVSIPVPGYYGLHLIVRSAAPSGLRGNSPKKDLVDLEHLMHHIDDDKGELLDMVAYKIEIWMSGIDNRDRSGHSAEWVRWIQRCLSTRQKVMRQEQGMLNHYLLTEQGSRKRKKGMLNASPEYCLDLALRRHAIPIHTPKLLKLGLCHLIFADYDIINYMVPTS